jgi:hypothetical protein
MLPLIGKGFSVNKSVLSVKNAVLSLGDNSQGMAKAAYRWRSSASWRKMVSMTERFDP